MKIERLSIEEIKKGYQNKSFSASELIKEYLSYIDKYDGKINAFTAICSESAMAAAEEIDKKLARGQDVGQLGGIPVAVKDNICTRNIKTTCSSKMLKDYVPPFDATVVNRLKKEGAIIIGKTNMDEFAMGSSTETSAFMTTKNPWDTSKVPGGSSGGSAAAVAAGFVPLAVGSDTGGSIRQPAAFCGAVGLKPTYGKVSRYGLIAFASSLDQIGPMTRTVDDCALALSIMQGHDPLDSTSIPDDSGDVSCLRKNSNISHYTSAGISADACKAYMPYEQYIREMQKGVKGMKIGVPREYLKEGLDGEIYDVVQMIIGLLENLGAQVEDVQLPDIGSCLSSYYIISSAEASSNLGRYDGIRYGYRSDSGRYDTDNLIVNSRTEGFGKEVKRRIMMGTYVLSSGYYDEYYKRAMLLRHKIKESFDNAFRNHDLLLMPASPILPFSIGERKDNPLSMYLADIYTVSVNIAGLPAISLPCGFSKTGLPIGLQLIGGRFMEHLLFRGAYSIEQELGVYKTAPVLIELKEAISEFSKEGGCKPC